MDQSSEGSEHEYTTYYSYRKKSSNSFLFHLTFISNWNILKFFIVQKAEEQNWNKVRQKWRTPKSRAFNSTTMDSELQFEQLDLDQQTLIQELKENQPRFSSKVPLSLLVSALEVVWKEEEDFS